MILKLSEMVVGEVEQITRVIWCPTRAHQNEHIATERWRWDQGISDEPCIIHAHLYKRKCNQNCVVVRPGTQPEEEKAE